MYIVTKDLSTRQLVYLHKEEYNSVFTMGRSSRAYLSQLTNENIPIKETCQCHTLLRGCSDTACHFHGILAKNVELESYHWES